MTIFLLRIGIKHLLEVKNGNRKCLSIYIANNLALILIIANHNGLICSWKHKGVELQKVLKTRQLIKCKILISNIYD